jgi:hypothetical protein
MSKTHMVTCLLRLRVFSSVMKLFVGGRRCGGNKPPPPPLVIPLVAARYGPLNFPPNVHDLPENYLKLFPKYDGEKAISAKEHMGAFQDFTHNLFMEHDDVFMRLFVQTLERDVRKWFRGLLATSICT